MSLDCGDFDLVMYVWHRDELKAQIEAITAKAALNLNEAQLRWNQEQSQATTEHQRLGVELEAALNVTKQITIERDDLITKIELLRNVNVKLSNWQVC